MYSYMTYQDFVEKASVDKADAIRELVNQWKLGDIYRTAVDADEYDAQRNSFIRNYVRTILSLTGEPLVDFTASNNKISSNFFHRLNTQRCTYSLGNGITFAKEGIKEKFGKKLDTRASDAGYFALIHGVTFVYIGDGLHVFKATGFAPLFDEEDGRLRAGARFWQLGPDKPMTVVFYEEDGKTKYTQKNSDSPLQEAIAKTKYRQITQTSRAFGTEVVGEENWLVGEDKKPTLPVVPWWGSKLHQSTLVGMKDKIDCFDLVRSGFANDLSDVAEIYWLVENYGGMRDEDLQRFRDRVKLNHIANVDTSQGGKVTPYKQDIPFEARQSFLASIRAGLYEDFGALDVHTVAAGATNDHIDAAYQPMDENADDFEYQVIEAIQNIGCILGIDEGDATPLFKRNRISNQKEQVDMLDIEAQWLDTKTIISKLPNVTVDEVQDILKRKEQEELDRFAMQAALENEQNPQEGEEEEEQ
jgi:hypothetical protein